MLATFCYRTAAVMWAMSAHWCLVHRQDWINGGVSLAFSLGCFALDAYMTARARKGKKKSK